MVNNAIVIKENGSGGLSLLNAQPIYRLSSSKNVVYLYASFSTANTIRVGFLLANGVTPAMRKVSQSSVDVDTLVESVDQEEAYNLWEYYIPSAVLNAVASKNASDVIISFSESEIEADADYLGTITSDMVDPDGDLDAEYPTVAVGNFANVWETPSNVMYSWEVSSITPTVWAKQSSVLNMKLVGTTGQLTLSVNASVNSDDEEIDITVTDITFDEITNLWTIVNALTGDVSDLMATADYDTEGTATKDVKYARNMRTSVGVNESTALEVKTTVDRVNQDVKDTASPTFVKVTVPTIDLGTAEITEEADERIQAEFDSGNIIILGEETNYLFKNDSGAQIDKGTPVYISGADGTNVLVKPAINTNHDIAIRTIGVMKYDCASAAKEKVVLFGALINVATDGSLASPPETWAAADEIYLNGVSGTLTNVRPTGSDSVIFIGVVQKANVSTGELAIAPRHLPLITELSKVNPAWGDLVDGDIFMYDASNGYIKRAKGTTIFMSRDIQNGAFKETFDLRYTHATSLMTLTNPGAGTDLTMQFSDGDTTLDVSALTIAPTFGTTTVPVKNYFYVPLSTKLLTKSTSAWPSEEHIKVAEITLLDETYTDANGPLGNQNHNNHETGTYDLGTLQHIREKLRSLGASWDSGVAGATGGEWVKDTAGTLDWTSTAGSIWQMHLQSYSAKDTSVSGDIHIVNDFTTPYTAVTSFDNITTYSDGSSIGNDYFNVFVYGVINKTSEYTPLMVNTPTDGYNNLTDAQTDLDSTLVTTVPTAFRRLAFPITRLLLRKVGGTYSFIQSYDLREQQFGIGGTTGSGVLDGEFIDTSFELQNVTDNTKVMKFSAANQTTGTIRTITMADQDVDIDTDILTPIATLDSEKIDKDFTGYTAVAIADTDIFVIYDISGSAVGKCTATALSTYVGLATGVFVENGIYDAETTGGVGFTAELAQRANSVQVFPLTYVSAGKYKCDMGTNTLTTNHIYYFVMPSNTDDTALEISVDNGSVYLDYKFDEVSINAIQVSEKLIKPLYDGTDFIADTDDGIKNVSVPYIDMSGKFALSKDALAIAISGRNNVLNLKNAFGGDLVQSIVNGNFANGTTDWTVVGGTQAVASGVNTVTVSGGSSGAYIRQYPLTIGQDYFITARVRVTNATATGIYLRDTGTIIVEELTPTQDKWYILSGAFTSTGTQFQIRHGYGDTVGGYEMEVDYAMVIPIDNTYLQEFTAVQIANKVEYFEGLSWIGKPETLDELLDNRYSFGNWTLGSAVVVDNDDNIPYIHMAYGDTPYMTFTIPSGDYSIFAHVYDNSLNQDLYVDGTAFGGSNQVIAETGENSLIKIYASSTGGTSIKLDTTATSGSAKVRLILIANDVTNLSDEEALEHIQSQEFGEFERKGIDIHSVAKNKFDVSSDIETEDVNLNSAGATQVAVGSFVSKYIDVSSLSSITLSVASSSDLRISEYDSGYTHILRTTATATSVTISSLNANTKYVRFSTVLTEKDTAQLELGTVATTYEEYLDSYLHIDGELHGIDNVIDGASWGEDNADTLDTQRFDEDINDVVQSATTWTPSAELTNTIRFRKDLESSLRYVGDTATSVLNKLRLFIGEDNFNNDTSANLLANDTEGVAVDNNRLLTIRVLKSRLTGILTADFEAYLQANDVTFIYKLETPLPRNAINNNEIDVYGKLLVDKYSTYEISSSSGLTSMFTTTIPLSTQGQILLNSLMDLKQEKDIIKGKQERDKLEVDIATNVTAIALNTVHKSSDGSDHELVFDDGSVSPASNVTLTRYVVIDNVDHVIVQFTLTLTDTVAGGGSVSLVSNLPHPTAQLNVVSMLNHTIQTVGSAFIDTSGELKTNTGGTTADVFEIFMTIYNK